MDRVTFQLGDIYHLQFPSSSFDVVLTVFESQFLDKQRAFPEFVRVIKPGGCLGINEMYKADEIPPKAIDNVRGFVKARLVSARKVKPYAKLSNHKNKIEDP